MKSQDTVRTNIPVTKIIFEDILPLRHILGLASSILLILAGEYIAIAPLLIVIVDIIINTRFDVKYYKKYDILFNSSKHISRANRNIKTLYATCDFCFLLFVFFTLIANAKTFNSFTFSEAVKKLVAPHIFILPTLLSIFVTLVKLKTYLSLKKKEVRIVNFASIISFNEVDSVSIVKESALTDGVMRLKIIVPLNSLYSENNIRQIVSNIINSTEDNDLVSYSIKRNVSYEITTKATAVCHYSEEKKYSGASFGTRGTFLIGTIDSLELQNKKGLSFRAEEYVSKGYFVYVLSHSNKKIEGELFDDVSDPIAFLVFEDNLRDGTNELINWLKENDLDIKLLSSKEPFYLNETAKSLGLNTNDKFTAIKDNNHKKMELLVERYSLFGDLSPSDKKDIINAISENKISLIIGSKIDDISAMSTAHTSVCFDNSDENVIKTSDAVLEKYDLSLVNTIIDESRKAVHKIRNLMSLFFTTLFIGMAIVISFSVVRMIDQTFDYPLNIFQVFFINTFMMFIPSLFVLFESNALVNEKKRYVAIPLISGIFVLLIMASLIILFFLRINGLIYEGYSRDPLVAYQQTKNMLAVVLAIFGCSMLYSLYYKNNKYRKITYVLMVIALVGTFGAIALISYLNKKSLPYINLDFSILTLNSWIIVAAIALLASVLYLYICFVYHSFKSRKEKK